MSITPHTDHQQAPPAGARWRLDPQSSSAEFSVPNLWGLATVRGRFDRLDGYLAIDGDGRRRMRLVIDAASLNTGNRRRDAHLRSADFFDCEHHPEVRFDSTSVADADDARLRVEGELQVAGRRVPLALALTVAQTDEQLEIHADTTVDQRRLGMTVSRFGIRTPAALTVHARLWPTTR